MPGGTAGVGIRLNTLILSTKISKTSDENEGSSQVKSNWGMHIWGDWEFRAAADSILDSSLRTSTIYLWCGGAVLQSRLRTKMHSKVPKHFTAVGYFDRYASDTDAVVAAGNLIVTGVSHLLEIAYRW